MIHQLKVVLIRKLKTLQKHLSPLVLYNTVPTTRNICKYQYTTSILLVYYIHNISILLVYYIHNISILLGYYIHSILVVYWYYVYQYNIDKYTCTWTHTYRIIYTTYRIIYTTYTYNSRCTQYRVGHTVPEYTTFGRN